MKLNEGQLATPTFGDKNEEINGEALEHWSDFIKVLSGIEKSFQSEKDQNKEIYVTLLNGMKEEAKRRLENIDVESKEPEESKELPGEQEKVQEPSGPEAEADAAENADHVPDETQESKKNDGDTITENEKTLIRMMELSGLPHPKSRIYKR